MALSPMGTNNIVGINSGIDTTALVNAIIESERGYARLLEVRQAEKTNMVTTYNALQAKLLALQASMAKLANGTLFNKAQSDVSDPATVSVTLGDSPAIGAYDVRVTQVARNHQVAAQGYADANAHILGTGTFKIAIGSGSFKTITLDANNNTLLGLKDAINSASAGVTATVVNDGSSANAYRLVLTAEKTGAVNKIKIDSTLSGGTSPDFATASFDIPEHAAFSSTATSSVALGDTASYSGTKNKTYSFTIAGNGSKTVGTDNVTVNWSDGANSGSILVTQADTEFTLTGTGSDGLTLKFAAGTLVGGDTFSTQAFAPTLQDPTDGKITVGSNDGSGSPIEIVSSGNVFKDVIAGVTINAKKISAVGEVVTIKTSRDVEGIKKEINTFISAYNDAFGTIDKQFQYDAANKSSGVLATESLLNAIQLSVRSSATGSVTGLDKKMATLATIGIRTGMDGKLKLASTENFEKALNTNIEGVRRLFSANGLVSGTNGIEFVSIDEDTKAGAEYKVDITEAATQGNYKGTAIGDPALSALVISDTNSTIQVKVDGITSSDITLSNGSYTTGDQLAKELQKKIEADSAFAGRGISVSWTDSGDTGFLTILSPSYGSSSRVEIHTPIGSDLSASQKLLYDTSKKALGFISGTTATGKNVAGTINGEKATGNGQFLVGNDKNKTTDGLRLRVTLTASQILSGDEGTISVTKGVAQKVRTSLKYITDPSLGSVNARVRGLNNEITDLKKQVIEIDKRLTQRRQSLFDKFMRMEDALGALNSESAFLGSQLGALSSNFGSTTARK